MPKMNPSDFPRLVTERWRLRSDGLQWERAAHIMMLWASDPADCCVNDLLYQFGNCCRDCPGISGGLAAALLVWMEGGRWHFMTITETPLMTCFISSLMKSSMTFKSRKWLMNTIRGSCLQISWNFLFLIRRIWIFTAGSALWLTPWASMNLLCAANCMGSCGEDGAARCSLGSRGRVSATLSD